MAVQGLDMRLCHTAVQVAVLQRLCHTAVQVAALQRLCCRAWGETSDYGAKEDRVMTVPPLLNIELREMVTMMRGWNRVMVRW